MANSDKNIRITTSKNKTTYPNIVFTGSAAGSSVITLEVLDDNTLSFTSNEGQVFSIDSNLSTGTIWAVSDISGVPLLSSSAGGTVGLAVYGGIVGIGQTNPFYKLDLKGSFGLASSNDGLYNFIFSNSAVSGSNSLSIRSANSLLFYNSGNTFYTGFKSNAAANITYTLPTNDGSSGQFLQTNGTGTLSWATATGGSGGTGSTAGVGQGGQYEMAYYPGTGLSVIGSNTFTNNTATGVVSITHSTVSTDFSNGAFKVTGGVGIGGSLYVGGIGASITGVTFSNSTITRGTWNGTAISPTYGGTGLNNSSATGLLQYSGGTASVITTSAALASIISDETGTAGKLVFSTSPVFTTSVTTDSGSFSVFNTTATTINAFGAATTLAVGAATGKATFNSTDDSSSTTTGSLAISGGAGIAKSVSIGGRLQMFNGANFTAFVSSASGNTVYTLPATSPATGSSVLQSTAAGVMSWVPLVSSSGSGLATTATNIYVNTLGNPNSSHAILVTPAQSSAGSAVSANGTLVYNPLTDVLSTPGLAVTSGVDSSSTTTGAFQVRGGIGVTGTGYFDVVRTRAIVTTGDVTVAGNFVVNGSIDFGNAVTDSISFIGRVDTDIDPIADNTYDLGVPGLAYRNASFGGSVYFTNSSNTNILALRAGATGSTLTYVFPIDTPTAGQVLSASAPSAGVVTLSWEDDQTGAPAGGITSLNGLGAASQSFATGTSGTDFAISSVTSTHTFNLPDASATARGLVTTGTQTIAGAKTLSSALSVTASTVAISTSTGALVVTGGVGIGGSLYVGGIGASISGLSVIQGVVNQGTWAGSTITAFYGGTGFNTYTKGDILVGFGNTFIRQGVGSDNFVLTASATSPSGVTWAAVPASAASSVAVISTVLDQVFYPTVVSAISGAGLGLSTVPFIQINPARGTFAAVGISAGTAITVVGNAVASSTTTGALQVIGGVGIGGSLFVGSASRFSATNVASSSGTGALTVSGGVGIGGSLYVASASQFESSVASINVGSGALVVTGGVGIGGSINAGGASRFSSTATAISIGTGALTVTGGAGIAGSLYVGEASRFTSSIASLNSGTGALTVTGGVGIGGSLNVALPSEFEATTAAIDVGSGALVVTGGVGIGGSVFAGGASRFTSSAASISSGTGALTVTGGVGIGGSVFTSTSVPSSISGVVLNNGLVTIGTWSGSTITSFYGGTGFNTYAVGDILYAATATSLGKLPSGSTNQVLTAQGPGTAPIWAAVPPSAASSVAVSSTVVDAVFYPTVISAASGTGLGLSTVNTIQINPARGTFAAVGISAGTAITVVGTAAAINTTTGALQAIGGVGIGGSLYVAGASRFSSSIAAISNGTGALTVTGGAGIGGSLYVGDASRFESNINSSTPGVGGFIATGGVGIGLSASIGGRLQMFNSTLYTAFVGAQSGVNTTYTLPTTSPAIGSSVLQSTSGGVMSWVPMTGGGSASPGGVVDGSTQFKSGSSFGGTRSFLWNELPKYLRLSGYPGGELYASGEAAIIVEQNYASFNGSVNGTMIGVNSVSSFVGSLLDLQVNAVSKFRIDYTGAITVGGAYALPTVDGLSGYVLKTNGAGTVTWQADSTGSAGAGSGTVAIPNAQHAVAYYAGTGASVSGSNTFTNNTSTGVVEITHTTESTSTTSGALQVDGGAGIAKSLFVGTTLSVGTTPSYNVPNNLASFVSTVNSYNQLVIQNKSNGTSASANLVVNNDVSTDAANYGEIGMNSSTFSGSGALNAAGAVYVAAHTAPLVLGTVTAHPIRFTVNSGATDILYISESGLAVSCFANFGLRSASDLRFWNSGNTFYAGIQGGATSANYLLTLPTAPVGAGLSAILVDTSGNMYFAPLEGGLAVTSATGNRRVLRNRMEHHVWMAAGYTPLAAGADNIIYVIPDSSEDGATKITFELKEFTIRVETPSAGSSRIQLERSSTDTGAFTLAATGSSLIGGSGLTISGAGIYVTTTNTFVAGTFVTSGNLLRLNYNLLNATHANFSVQFTLNEV